MFSIQASMWVWFRLQMDLTACNTSAFLLTVLLTPLLSHSYATAVWQLPLELLIRMAWEPVANRHNTLSSLRGALTRDRYLSFRLRPRRSSSHGFDRADPSAAACFEWVTALNGTGTVNPARPDGVGLPLSSAVIACRFTSGFTSLTRYISLVHINSVEQTVTSSRYCMNDGEVYVWRISTSVPYRPMRAHGVRRRHGQ